MTDIGDIWHSALQIHDKICQLQDAKVLLDCIELLIDETENIDEFKNRVSYLIGLYKEQLEKLFPDIHDDLKDIQNATRHIG